ncbi:uncharacterized protein LOC112520109 [Cynara cardunculus var. scolymus]|uniref:C2 calcium-dependent membrane targeting n=1 Tax=Cynara cardunculus var. scolymus TaxID=59895 RepID=A0A118JZV2_CYNCS|nr:uncharacterized protein LOC112520109 [Cynara cardunculus var. scolymus]KVI00418.1 C2 calcium-dependent membrane targeting [Cynara cardunculus var. scolymus]
MPASKPYQLLEVSVMSAQDLEPTWGKMKTYATAWIHTRRKLSTRIDSVGGANPTWNDKFVFRVDEEFLCLDDSSVMIEIYATNWLRDTLVGTVRVLVGNVVSHPQTSHNKHYTGGMRCVALQVRRPSGRPQGILNVGMAVLDSSMRSMPLYSGASAVGYSDLMRLGDVDTHQDPNYHRQTRHDKNDESVAERPFKPVLLRSRSESSSMYEHLSVANSSLIAVPKKPASSILDEPCFAGLKSKKGKASSVVSGEELREKPKPKGKKKRSSSIIGVPIFSKPEPVSKKSGGSIVGKQGLKPSASFPHKASSVWSESEVGPSASEVAMAIMERKYPLDDARSSVLDGWSEDGSEEGLQSKLERWRREKTPLFDRGSSKSSSFQWDHKRRHTVDDVPGMFSCFGSVCGMEFQCVCGDPNGAMDHDGGLSP